LAREIEFKFRVRSAEDLGLFARTLGFELAEHPARTQRNSFFESPDGRLAARGLALRLRTEGERSILTVKGRGAPRSEDGALVERLESEAEIASDQARAILDGRASPLAALEAAGGIETAEAAGLLRAALEGAELELLGTFENERTTLPAVEVTVAGRPERLVFELDRTRFPGDRVDFEIEAEIGPEADAEGLREHLHGLLAQAGVEWMAAPSKLARFREQLEAGRGGAA